MSTPAEEALIHQLLYEQAVQKTTIGKLRHVQRKCYDDAAEFVMVTKAEAEFINALIMSGDVQKQEEYLRVIERDSPEFLQDLRPS